jgi:hypothetical protein
MNNQPAFPHTHLGINKGALSSEATHYEDGMTLRDYFAKAAMQAFLTFIGPDTEAGFDTIAQMAYDMAEAMMEQREKRP